MCTWYVYVDNSALQMNKIKWLQLKTHVHTKFFPLPVLKLIVRDSFKYDNANFWKDASSRSKEQRSPIDRDVDISLYYYYAN